MEEQKDVNPESSLEGAIAESPAAQQEAQEVVQQPEETQTPPAETEGVTPEPIETPAEEGKIPYDRFKEKVDETNWLKQQLEAERQARVQPAPVQSQDPDVGKTPEEKVFWQQVRQEAAKAVSPQIEAAKQEFARIRAEKFFGDHPDIKAGTPEETQIAQKVSQGYLPDDAYRVVMWDSKVGQQQVKTQQTQQQRLQAKRQANVVSQSSVSQQSTPSKNETFDEELTRKLNTEWDGNT